jgi:cytochrome c oxidase subunit II
MKSFSLVFAIIAVGMIVAACTTQTPSSVSNTPIKGQINDVQPNAPATNNPPATNPADAGSNPSTGNTNPPATGSTASTSTTKTFTMTASQFAFDPSTITVNKGDTVVIKVKSTDVTHGFALPDFGIDQKLEPNNEVTITFVADKTGTFTFFCNVPCGVGHREMKGTITVL